MIETFTLSNGLTVVMENIAQLRSVAIGVWLRAGSALEAPAENGLAHLMEHMAFKGTATRTARQLADEMDAIGGHVNAATSKLYTTYFARVCDTDLERAVELLADVTLNPTMDAKELSKEQNVILEEIAMSEDSPEDLAYELINRALYGTQSLAMPIAGTKEGVAGFTRDDLLRFRQKVYHPTNTVISVAGRVNRKHLQEVLEQWFGNWSGSGTATYPAGTVMAGPGLALDKKTEQVQLCMGYPGLPYDDPQRYTMLVFNTLFGGGVSSRLFQRIREEQGLVYSIYSAPSAYPAGGDFIICAGATPKSARKVLKQVQLEVQTLLKEGVQERELEQAKAQLRTGYVLSQESAYSRMSSLGTNQLIRGRIVRPSEVLNGIKAVTPRKVMRLAQQVLAAPPTLAIVGKRAQQYLPD